MHTLLAWLRRLRRDREGVAGAEDARVDAANAALQHEARDVGLPGANAPVGYFPKQDDGRPRR